MEELIALIISNPAVATFVEGICAGVIADVFHRRALDPEFAKKSDAAYAAYATATTDESKQNALQAIQALHSSPRS